MQTTYSSWRRFLAAAGALAVLVAPAAAEAPASYHVLAVGVSKYKDGKVGPWPGAAEAEKMIDLFKGRKGKVRTRLLTNAEATAAGIKAALRDVRDKAGKGDFIVLYLSGHGASTPAGWLFLPHDFNRKDLAGTVLRESDLLGAADVLAARGHDVLLAVESCHSGMLITKAKALGLVESRRPKKPGRGALVVATSCRPSQFSFASRLDGGREYTAWFTTALREGLGGRADANRDGVVTLKELQGFLEARLHTITHTHPKLPGLAWPEQCSICLGSPEASVGLRIVRADAKKGETPQQVVDGEFVPPSPDLFQQFRKGPPPVGTWKLIKCNKRALRVDYSLTIRADGTYTARLKKAGGVEKTEGKYEYTLDGMFTLVFPGGRDQLMYFGRSEDRMTVRVQCAPFDQDDTFFELERKKE